MKERVLHVHLKTPQDPQKSLCDALKALGSYQQVDWLRDVASAPRRIVAAAEEFQPTLVFAQLQGDAIPVDTWKEVRRVAPKAKLVSWCGDIGRPLAWAEAIAPHFDVLLFSSVDQLEIMRSRGVPHVGYLQIGYDVDWFHPPERPVEPVCDVVFLGQNYVDSMWQALPDHEAELRRQVVVALSGQFNVHVYGQNWQGLGVLAREYLPPEETPKLYWASRLALSISLTSKYKNYTSDRLFRAMACGTPTLVKRFSGCESEAFGLVAWKNCFLFDTPGDCVTLVKTLLQDDPEVREGLRAVGAEGAKFVRKRHTWASRMEPLQMILVQCRTGGWP